MVLSTTVKNVYFNLSAFFLLLSFSLSFVRHDLSVYNFTQDVSGLSITVLW